MSLEHWLSRAMNQNGQEKTMREQRTVSALCAQVGRARVDVATRGHWLTWSARGRLIQPASDKRRTRDASNIPWASCEGNRTGQRG